MALFEISKKTIPRSCGGVMHIRAVDERKSARTKLSPKRHRKDVELTKFAPSAKTAAPPVSTAIEGTGASNTGGA
jgi:hypothetical protein